MYINIKTVFDMKKINLLAIATFAALVSSCSLFQKNAVTAKPTPVEPPANTSNYIQDEKIIEKILYGEWTVADVNGKGVVGDTRPYVIFDTTAIAPIMKYYANNGCNVLNGKLEVSTKGIMKKASEGLSTMMFCPDAPYEMGINLALETVASFSIEKIAQDYLLYMKNAEGNTMMILRKSDISFINGAWTVTKINGKAVKPDAGIEMVIDIPELKVHGNTGCNILNGQLFVDPDKQNSLQFTNLATTRMACPDAELEQQFLVSLEQVETVIPGKDDDTALLKDKSGNVMLELKRLNLTTNR